MNDDRGFTVAEALTALLLLLLVLDVGWAVSAATARSAAAIADRGESLATARAIGWILQQELAGVRAGVDIDRPVGDSFSIRAFRGAAIVCSQRSSTEVTVRWTGVRSPDSTKDSVILLTRDGHWAARALLGRSGSSRSCAAGFGGTEEVWRLSAPTPPSTLGRFFERGSYHLSDDALRYRIGGGGRQPLTPPTVDPALSGLTASSDGRLRVSVATLGARGGREGPAWGRTFFLPGTW